MPNGSFAPPGCPKNGQTIGFDDSKLMNKGGIKKGD